MLPAMSLSERQRLRAMLYARCHAWSAPCFRAAGEVYAAAMPCQSLFSCRDAIYRFILFITGRHLLMLLRFALCHYAAAIRHATR